MDRNFDSAAYGAGFPPYMSSMYPDMNMDTNNFENTVFNPMSQYEQGYMYYRYMTQQMDYKIKCKEFDRLCSTNSNSNSKNERKID